MGSDNPWDHRIPLGVGKRDKEIDRKTVEYQLVEIIQMDSIRRQYNTIQYIFQRGF